MSLNPITPLKALPLAACLALLALLPARAETLHQIGHSAISQVTAYQGQGIVTREVSLELAGVGDHQLRISDIPLGIVGDSLHVSGQGVAGTVIHNVQLMPLPPGHASPELKELQARLRELEAQRARLNNAEALGERTQEWLDSYWERQEAEGSRPRPEDWQQTLNFLSRNQAAVLEQATATALQKQALDVRLAELRQELQTLTASESHKTQAAVVYFSNKSKGKMTFQLRYVIQGIRWPPSYDARLDEKNANISLTYFGDVVQSTGEDWQSVELSLSTAVPQINAAVPVLAPWILTHRLPEISQSRSNLPANNRDLDGSGGFGEEVDERIPADDEAGFAESEIQTQGLSVLFAIPQRVSIESAPHPRRVAIATRSFSYTPEYHVVPKLSPRVYLKARFRNSGDLPLLAGQIRTHVDRDYTGTSQIPLVRPNEEASLTFGVDENIRVTRREGAEQSSLEGLMRDTRRRVMSYEIEISNYKAKPVNVVVWDHLPLVQHEEIRLKILQLQPEPSERSKSNLLKWIIPLQPQEKRKIQVSYAVEHPLSLEVYTNFSNEVQPLHKQRRQEQYEKF
ncbi:MAG: hypothetical protein CVV27_10510 [Candidatus Melainabacteria bacterium HGW-Melainabacteria-1]|nr:MAG: hypothetical protein CVV27_10510 [Candidatus Melainabacteria bacterium HGW-Melainabacteria-1]